MPGLLGAVRAGLHETVGSKPQRWKEEISEAVVRLVSQDIYKVLAVMGALGEVLGQAVTAVLDTGAGPNFVRRMDLPSSRTTYGLPSNIPRVVGAIEDGVKMLGVVELSIQVGGFHRKEWVVVTEHLHVPLILGASYIDVNVQTLSPQLRHIT